MKQMRGAVRNYLLTILLIGAVVTVTIPSKHAVVASASTPTMVSTRTAQLVTEPPHPILSIPGNGSNADAILANYTEQQFLEFVPRQAPRGAAYGFVAAVVPGDTGWSWNAANPNQLVSTPSGTVFPNPNYQLRTDAVPVLSGNTVNVPYYIAAGSSTRKSLVFAEIDYRKRGKLRADMLQLAAKYVLSGTSPATRDNRYARRIAVALDLWATSVPDYFMTEKNSPTFISAVGFTQLTRDIQRASDHNGLAHEWSDDELLAFDAIYDSQALADLSAEKGYDVREHVKNNLFCNIGDFIANRVPVSVAIATNLSGPFTVLAQVARVLNKPNYILWMGDYLDQTIRRKIMRDGVLPEGIGYSYGYVVENLDASRQTRDYFLTRPDDTPELTGIRNRAVTYASLLQYGQGRWNALRLPDGRFASFGDTNFNSITARNTGVSGLLPAYGHVLMGTGAGTQAVQVNQNFSDDSNHMRADVTGFTLWAMNNELLGNIRYYNGTPGRQFTEQILSHNAVTIDRVNMSRGPWNVGNNNHRFTSGNLTLYEQGNNGLAVTEIDGQRAYANKASRYQRIMILNTSDPDRPYVLDVFRVTGGRTHDYTLHGAIRFDQTWECSFPLTPNPAQYPMLEGSETWVEPTSSGSTFPYYGFWRDVSNAQAPGNFHVTYRDTSPANRDLRLWMTDSGTANVYLGRTPNPERTNTTPPDFYRYWRPSLIMRQRISEGTLASLFAGVVEPLRDGNSTIQSVERLPITDSSLEAVALRVTFVDGRVDTLLINLNNPRVAGVASGGAQTVSTADGQYVLTGRIGAYTTGPRGTRAWTVAASDFQYAGRRLTTPNNFYQGTITGMIRRATGGSGDAFITNAALPLGTTLRGRQLSLIFDTYRVVGSTAIQRGISEMFEIDRVEQVDGQTYIHFARDHQLVMNGNNTIEQVAPERTFEGPLQFEIALSNSAQPCKFDFDGDGRADISVFRPTGGEWWYQQSIDNNVRGFQFGGPTDKPVPADYDGDGRTDIAIWRPSTGEWLVLRSSNLTFFGAPFGASSDIPAPGDFDGDGRADFTVFRPSQGTWYINKTTGGVQITQFGADGDHPVVADYDGDGKADIAIFRQSDGSWWMQRSTAGFFATVFGSSADKPVQADYTGDGKADIAFWQPSNGYWYVLRSEDYSYYAAPFGAAEDIPASADYDGDGRADFAVFRPSNGTWFIQRSTQGTYIQQFGLAGDIPGPSAYVP